MTANPPFSSVLQIAEHRGHQAAAARRDLRAALFPASAYPPDEMTVATTRARMKAWVDSLEADLLARIGIDHRPGESGGAWPVLLGGRLLDDPLVIDAAHGEAAYHRLQRRAWALRGQPAVPPLLARLAAQPDTGVADAAIALLTAEVDAAGAMPHRQLAAELLHLLCWRTVASLEVAGAAPIADLVEAGSSLLADHAEQTTRQASALRLAFLIDRNDPGALDPASAGPTLFIAALSRATRIDFAMLCRMAVETDHARICVAMRAAGLSPQDVAVRASFLAGDAGSVPVDSAAMETLAPDAARTLCLRWAATEGAAERGR